MSDISTLSTMNPSELTEGAPSYEYDGTPHLLYSYLNSAKQWLNIVGNTRKNVIVLLNKLGDNASLIISTKNHEFNFDIIEETLKRECDTNRDVGSMIVDISNTKKTTTYKDLISDLELKLWYVNSKLHYKYEDFVLVEAIMEPYLHMAQYVLRKNLPFEDQLYVFGCGFKETAQKILELETSGRFDTVKQRNTNVMPQSNVYHPKQNPNNPCRRFTHFHHQHYPNACFTQVKSNYYGNDHGNTTQAVRISKQ